MSLRLPTLERITSDIWVWPGTMARWYIGGARNGKAKKNIRGNVSFSCVPLPFLGGKKYQQLFSSTVSNNTGQSSVPVHCLFI